MNSVSFRVLLTGIVVEDISVVQFIVPFIIILTEPSGCSVTFSVVTFMLIASDTGFVVLFKAVDITFVDFWLVLVGESFVFRLTLFVGTR